MCVEAIVHIFARNVFLLLLLLRLQLLLVRYDCFRELFLVESDSFDQGLGKLIILFALEHARVLDLVFGLLRDLFEQREDHAIVRVLQLGWVIAGRAVLGRILFQLLRKGVEVGDRRCGGRGRECGVDLVNPDLDDLVAVDLGIEEGDLLFALLPLFVDVALFPSRELMVLLARCIAKRKAQIRTESEISCQHWGGLLYQNRLKAVHTVNEVAWKTVAATHLELIPF